MDGSTHLPNMTPFDAVSTDAEDLITEARNWADGEPITTQQQADDVSRLIEALRLNAKAADDARKEENKPHDEAKAAVQAKFAPLYADPKTKAPGAVFKAQDALKAVLAPFLKKLDDEKREAARLAQEEADRAAAAAREAMQAAAPDNLAAREEAEAVAQAADDGQKAAKAAANDKALATGGARAMGLRSKWTATLSNAREAAAHYWTVNPDAFSALLQKLADDDVRAGKRTIPGFTVSEERVL